MSMKKIVYAISVTLAVSLKKQTINVHIRYDGRNKLIEYSKVDKSP